MNVISFLKNCNPFKKKEISYRFVIYDYSPNVKFYEGPFTLEKANAKVAANNNTGVKIYTSLSLPRDAEHIDGKEA